MTNTLNNLSLAKIFADNGPLARHSPDYHLRSQQLQMAQAIQQAFAKPSKLIIEAGTGTGKTFAYLVPALLSQQKVIISTGTKNLQDQLFQRDLPWLRQILGVAPTTALLKGRANYICRHHLNRSLQEGRLHSRQLVAQLHKIDRWVRASTQGDIAEFAQIPEDSMVWSHVTSTSDNCLGKECDFYDRCFLVKARQKAQKAQIIVINHHLFFADLILRDTGFGEILPGADAVIFDEAHQLPETASLFFGESLSSRQLLALAQDTHKEAINQAADDQALINLTQTITKHVADLRLSFGSQLQRRAWHEIAHKPSLKENIQRVMAKLVELQQHLDKAAVRSKELKNCHKRCGELLLKFKALTQIQAADAATSNIYWFETFRKAFVLHQTPLSVAGPFGQAINQEEKTWIFTSATLAVSTSFAYFQENLGVEDAKTLLLDCPFDYTQQALLYIPQHLPLPHATNYLNAMLEVVVPVLKITQGRAFLLFTSHTALQQAAHALQAKLSFPLLVQGSAAKASLLGQFRELGNAVLLGTYSFWEGVDVKGKALSCVVIDKLPFAAPSDPLIKAKIQALRQQGQDPFYQYQLSQAVIALKQGAGRLIRDRQDRGVLMICDPRLLAKPYGKLFLQSLPPMPLTQALMDVEKFFDETVKP